MNSLFNSIYGDIYSLGESYKKAFCAAARIILSFLKKVGKLFAGFFVFVFTFFKKIILKYAKAVKNEAVQFAGEVKRAFPVLKAEFKEKPVKGIFRFLKYTFHAFAVHERFNRAVLSTLIPVFAVVFLFSFNSTFRAVTFAVDVYIDGESVGTVKDENAYKEAYKDASLRLSSLGSELEQVVPEYRITVTTVAGLDDNETVSNNIIAAVSDKTVNACGVFVDGEFLCAVGSEDTFIRVSNRVLGEYAEASGYTADNCTVGFYQDVTTVTGLYPDSVKMMTADELYAYMTGYSQDNVEHTVKAEESLEDILSLYGITEEYLLEINQELDTENIPEGSVLLIKEGKKNLSIRLTETYIRVETIPFDTVSQFDNNIAIGTTMTVVSGVEGQDVVSYTDTYIDGKKVDSSRELLRFNARMPVNQLVKIGTMGVPVGDDSIPVSPRLTRDQGGRFVWPAPDNCFWLSQGYNPYNSHYGIDIVSSDDGSCRGRRIVSVADGVVIMATYHWSWGYYIRVDHGSGVVTGYAHALEGSFRVNVGDFVRAGQHLSSIGTTGNSTGYHLHFEVWLDGTRVNPLPYVYSEYLGVAVK
ncbi:MAG: peptidoglycan DD-metalloendopeptidase family protein [Clostridia bacterium]|nr:peptidoglycan DD-metalloendopeptidase family protein [Clostridia bacterium]